MLNWYARRIARTFRMSRIRQSSNPRAAVMEACLKVGVAYLAIGNAVLNEATP
jgi:hypothetical protein